MKKRIAIFAVAAVLCVTTARGFFGITVFDPTNWIEAVNQLRQLEQQYSQLVQTYQMVRSQYTHMVQMAKTVPVSMFARYKALVTPWKTSTASNTYGTTGGWINGANSGSGVTAGYQKAVETLEAYGKALANVPADQIDRVKKSYGTVELADGANLHTMETIGALRQNAPEVERAIRGLEEDSLSLDRDMNTEVAVLNKINAASVIALRNAQDANKVLVALSEQSIVESKRKRDSEALAINNHIKFMADGRGYLSSQKADATKAMTEFRMP